MEVIIFMVDGGELLSKRKYNSCFFATLFVAHVSIKRFGNFNTILG
jgi:hypothetical protein